MMTADKRQLIDEIAQFNAGARVSFLKQFEARDLQQYLEHLKAAQNRTVRIGGWVRAKPSTRCVA